MTNSTTYTHHIHHISYIIPVGLIFILALLRIFIFHDFKHMKLKIIPALRSCFDNDFLMIPLFFISAFFLVFTLFNNQGYAHDDYNNQFFSHFNQSKMNYSPANNTYTLRDNTTKKIATDCNVIKNNSPHHNQNFQIYCNSTKEYLHVKKQ